MTMVVMEMEMGMELEGLTPDAPPPTLSPPSRCQPPGSEEAAVTIGDLPPEPPSPELAVGLLALFRQSAEWIGQWPL